MGSTLISSVLCPTCLLGTAALQCGVTGRLKNLPDSSRAKVSNRVFSKATKDGPVAGYMAEHEWSAISVPEGVAICTSSKYDDRIASVPYDDISRVEFQALIGERILERYCGSHGGYVWSDGFITHRLVFNRLGCDFADRGAERDVPMSDDIKRHGFPDVHNLQIDGDRLLFYWLSFFPCFKVNRIDSGNSYIWSLIHLKLLFHQIYLRSGGLRVDNRNNQSGKLYPGFRLRKQILTFLKEGFLLFCGVFSLAFGCACIRVGVSGGQTFGRTVLLAALVLGFFFLDNGCWELSLSGSGSFFRGPSIDLEFALTGLPCASKSIGHRLEIDETIQIGRGVASRRAVMLQRSP